MFKRISVKPLVVSESQDSSNYHNPLDNCDNRELMQYKISFPLPLLFRCSDPLQCTGTHCRSLLKGDNAVVFLLYSEKQQVSCNLTLIYIMPITNVLISGIHDWSMSVWWMCVSDNHPTPSLSILSYSPAHMSWSAKMRGLFAIHSRVQCEDKLNNVCPWNCLY